MSEFIANNIDLVNLIVNVVTYFILIFILGITTIISRVVSGEWENFIGILSGVFLIVLIILGTILFPSVVMSFLKEIHL